MTEFIQLVLNCLVLSANYILLALGLTLIFGILRKEANLALLISFAGGAAVTSVISPLQMVVFSIVIMLYIPCISTIAVLWKETGLRVTAGIVVAEIALAILIGGLAYRLLGLFL